MPEGIESKPPSKGAFGCASGTGLVFATKGNNTQGFYVYDTGSDTWRQLADVPLGNSNKKVKGGTGMALVNVGGTDYIYLLKGSKNEFWRYSLADSSWHSLHDAPADKYDKGSFIVYDDARTIYCHRAKYNELHAYDVIDDSWSAPLSGMPLIGMLGKSKKSKDGGSGTLYGADIFALKGGNTQEFWRYSPTTDSWHELDTMPLFGTEGKKKKVKAGAGITAACGDLYALKGNKTSELWKYHPGMLDAPRLRTRGGVAAGAMHDAASVMRITPNPMRPGFATVRFDTHSPGPSISWSVSVYDASGRQVVQSKAADRKTDIQVDLRGLAPGVYVVKLAGGRYRSTQKLVVGQY
jgi:hypothetical protein